MSQLDFSTCLFDPSKIAASKKVQELYPELLPYKEYLEIPKEDWVVGICLTDLGSPFVKIKDHKQKMEAIFDHFKYSRSKGDSAVSFARASEYRPCGIMDVCSFMIEYQNNHDFAAWFVKNQSYYELMKAIMKPMLENDSEDKYWDRKFKNQERAAKIAQELKEIETSLFGSAAMKTAAARSKKKLVMNYAEKYAMPNNSQVE